MRKGLSFIFKKRIKTQLLLVVLVLFSAPSLFSQINGKVVSEDDNSPLPYASVFTPDGQFAFTNDAGYFTLKGQLGQKVTITYLGYRDTTIVIDKASMIVRMKNDSYMTEEVVITDKNYISPYKTLARARKKYQKEDGDKIMTKLFVKRESVNNGDWADRTEVLYNYTHKNRRIYDLEFKHGKSYINSENDVILTLDLFNVMKGNWIFDKKQASLYPSIISHSSTRKMRAKFDASYSEFVSNDKTYFVISSNPLKNGEGFSSKITVDKQTDDFVEIHNVVENPKEVHFKSIRTGKPIDLSRIEFTYKFVQYNDITILSHIDVSYTYFLGGVESINTLAFHFYDYEKPFKENISEIDYFPLSDYQKVWETPYSENFWNEQNIVESSLDTTVNYLNLNAKMKSLLEKKKYLTIEDVELVTPVHFAHVPLLDDGSPFKYKVDSLSILSKLHVDVFFHVNMFSYDGKMEYEVTPLINYTRTFIHDESPLVIRQFNVEIELIKKFAEELDVELNNRQSEKSNKESEVVKIVDDYTQNLWRALDDKDNYQFMDWTPYKIEKEIERKLRFRRM